jgi:hypothetical protein
MGPHTPPAKKICKWQSVYLRMCSVPERGGMEWNGSVPRSRDGSDPVFDSEKNEERNGFIPVFDFGMEREWNGMK